MDATLIATSMMGLICVKEVNIELENSLFTFAIYWDAKRGSVNISYFVPRKSNSVIYFIQHICIY